MKIVNVQLQRNVPKVGKSYQDYLADKRIVTSKFDGWGVTYFKQQGIDKLAFIKSKQKIK